VHKILQTRLEFEVVNTSCYNM